MTIDTALWLGIAAGLVIGTAATWISIAVAIALGRHLAHRNQLLEHSKPYEPPTDTFDNNLRDLIRDHQKKHQ